MKNRMRKMIPLMIVFVMLAGVVGCGNGSTTSENNNLGETTVKETTTTVKTTTTAAETTTEATTQVANAVADEAYYEPEQEVYYEPETYYEAENYYEPEQNYDYVPEDSGGSGGVTVPDAVWEGDNLVWIPVNGGTKYHTNAGCSNMKDPIQVPLEQAVANGFEPCKRCH